MEFGFYITCYDPYPDRDDPARLYREALEQAVIAEDVGFGSISIPEHHFANYLTIPSPLMMATTVAAKTKSVPIVTAVIVLPFYDPIRLAGEIAMADALSEGRLELGLGRGAFLYEFERFGITIPESRPRFAEAVELLDRLLTEEEVTHEGQFYSITEPLTIMPRPVQQPRPPFWMAVLSEGAIGWAVSNGHNVQTTPLRDPFEVAEKQARWFCDARDAAGTDATQQRHHMLRNVYVSKDRKDLEQKAALLHENHQRFTNLFDTPGTVDGGLVRPLGVDISADDAAANVIFGTPDEVIERLKLHESLGIDGIQCNMAFGASHADIVSCMELFAAEVMPEFQQVAVSDG